MGTRPVPSILAARPPFFSDVGWDLPLSSVELPVKKWAILCPDSEDRGARLLCRAARFTRIVSWVRMR